MSSHIRWGIVLLIALALFPSLSCKDYQYASPLPGILEIRLGVKNNRTDLLPFSPLNLFQINVRRVLAIEPGDLQLELFADVNAIGRNVDGDQFNCLDTLARDSALVLARGYAPPGTYNGIDVEVTPTPFIALASGFFPSVIEVNEPLPPPAALQQLPAPGTILNINVQEGRLTRATVTFDLDSSLVRRTETFLYRPYFYVSFVQSF